MTDSEPASPISSPDLASGLLRLVQHYQRIGIGYFPRGDAHRGIDALARLLPAATDGRPADDVEVSADARAPSRAAPAAANTPAADASPPPEPVRPSDWQPAGAGGGLPLAERQQRLHQLAAAVATCTRCEMLAASRTQTVFGEGNPQARVCFFGEAPGADEDRQGRPFVGAAGKLLTKMIEACSMRREDVYILNTIKCRPPGNRNPEPAEVAHCRDYFETQLDIIRPEYIVCLGAVAAQALLRSKLPVGHLRGRFHDYRNSKVLVTYHPAYLLRNPSAKRAAWDDLKIMLRDIGITPQ